MGAFPLEVSKAASGSGSMLVSSAQSLRALPRLPYWIMASWFAAVILYGAVGDCT